MKSTTIVIPFAYTPKWGQIVIASLKEFYNQDFDILVMNNSPERDDIKAITETTLGEGVRVETPPPLQRWHGGALDYGIELIDTPYLFALETDCTVERGDWLEWYMRCMVDDYVAMAGWFWCITEDTNDGRHYINSSATLYNTKILKLLLKECQNNKETDLVCGMNYEHRHPQDHFKRMVEQNAVGPFSDSRGFQHHNYPVPRPEKWSHEPGSWIFNRASCQWECIRLPGKMVNTNEPKAPQVKYNYYGDSEDNPYVLHYWGGTVSHNFDKHLVTVHWEVDSMEWWLRREDRIWKEYVPHTIRQKSIEQGLVKSFDEEFAYALSRVHLLNPGTKIRAYHHEVPGYILKEVEEPVVIGDGLNATIVDWGHDDGLWIAQFDEEPIGAPYHKQREEGGKWYANLHPMWCVRR
jgi:hypothetical protein